jgi:hypothetical protein
VALFNSRQQVALRLKELVESEGGIRIVGNEDIARPKPAFTSKP